MKTQIKCGWWMSLSSPWYFGRWLLLLFCVLFTTTSYFIDPYFESKNMFGASGAITSLAGLFLNIKHGQFFHLRLPLKEKFDKYTGGMVFTSLEFKAADKLLIKNVMLDEVIGTAYIVIGTFIWAYG
jgi:hypothetical protein